MNSPFTVHSQFIDSELGNLIGILAIFSLLVPLSSLLRSVVLEREQRLKEPTPPPFCLALRPGLRARSPEITPDGSRL